MLPERTVDLNVHYGPDVVKRSQTAVEALEMAQRLGLRGICVRSHTGSSTDLAHALDAMSTGPRVVGGLTLNRSAGGINIAAVEAALATGARVISLPTWHSAAASDDPIRVDPGDSALRAVFSLVGRSGACLDLGMAPDTDVLPLIDAATAAGVRRIVVSHPFHKNQNYSAHLQADAVRAGAVIEHCFMQFAPGYPGAAAVTELVSAIRLVGCAHVVLSSDSGLVNMPELDTALPEFHRMLAPHFSADELSTMFSRTPAELLGL